MGNLLNPDNKFFTFMSRVADLMLLNILCIICCIPVVTAGPAITALYYVTLKMARNEESYIFKAYFHSFRQNLKQGILIGLIMLFLGVLLIFDLYFIRLVQAQNPGAIYTVALVVFIAFGVLYLIFFSYVFSILARFYNTVKNTLKNAALMAIRHLPASLIMFGITVAPVILMLFFSERVFSFMILYMVLLGFAAGAYFKSTLLVKIFDFYTPVDPEETEDDGDVFDTSAFSNLRPDSYVTRENDPFETPEEEISDPSDPEDQKDQKDSSDSGN